MRRLAFLALTLATGCSDALEKTSSAGQVIGVINVSDLSLVSATDFSVTTRSWPGTTAGPSAIAGGGRTFVVTLEQANARSEEHTSELQSRGHLVCRLLLEKKKKKQKHHISQHHPQPQLRPHDTRPQPR